MIVEEVWPCKVCGGHGWYYEPACPEGSTRVVACLTCDGSGEQFQELCCDGDCGIYFMDLELSEPQPRTFLYENEEMVVRERPPDLPPVWCTKPEYFAKLGIRL